MFFSVSHCSRGGVLLAVICCLAGIASAVPIAPSKTWCKTSSVSGDKKKYALFPSGQCALCEFGVYGPNHCDERIGQVCSQGPTYATVKKDGYRYCVCGSGWYGSPKGDKAGATISFAGEKEAGCAVCKIFGTTTSKINSTKLSQCDRCRGDLQFTGKAPFCVWNPTKFAAPNCSIPEPWQTYGVKLPGSAGCGCQAGTFGTWPDCRPCPVGLTSPAGNGLTCTCDRKQGFVKQAGGKCGCYKAKGYYPTYQNSTACVLCKNLTGTTVTKGKCGCDASKGYGRNIAAQGSPICIKCSDANMVLHKASGECRCKSGYGVEIGYDSTASAGQDYSTYCVPCNKPGHVVNGKGFCSCSSGYARTRYVSNRVCIPCSGNNKIPVLQLTEYPQPICGCKPGYEGSIYSATDGQCNACGADRTADASKITPLSAPYYDDFCHCKDPRSVFEGNTCKKCWLGFVRDPKSKKCVLGAACKSSKWTARFWSPSAIGPWNGTFFPNQVLEKATPATKTLTLKTLSIDLKAKDIPFASGRFAAVFEIFVDGNKAAPYWLGKGQGRYTSNSRLISAAVGSKVSSARLFDSGFGVDFVTSQFIDDSWSLAVESPAGVYGDLERCRSFRVYWWGQVGQTASLKVQFVRSQGSLGWF